MEAKKEPTFIELFRLMRRQSGENRREAAKWSHVAWREILKRIKRK